MFLPKSLLKKALLAMALAAAWGGSAAAQSTLTTAGTDVTATFTLDYNISGQPQTQQSSGVSFTVDRIVDFRAYATGIVEAYKGVETTAAFYIENTGNDNATYSINIFGVDETGTPNPSLVQVGAANHKVSITGDFPSSGDPAIDVTVAPDTVVEPAETGKTVAQDVGPGETVVVAYKLTYGGIQLEGDAGHRVIAEVQSRDPGTWQSASDSPTRNAVTSASVTVTTDGVDTLLDEAESTVSGFVSPAGDGIDTVEASLQIKALMLSADGPIVHVFEGDGTAATCGTFAPGHSTPVTSAIIKTGTCVVYSVQVNDLDLSDSGLTSDIALNFSLNDNFTFVSAEDSNSFLTTVTATNEIGGPCDDQSTVCNVEFSGSVPGGLSSVLLIRALFRG